MRPLPPIVLACLLALSTTSAVALPSAPDGDDGRAAGTRRPQTSDGVVGETAAVLPPFLRGVRQTSRPTSWRVAPGVGVTRWDERDARGPVRLYLLSVKWRTPGVKVDYANAGPVRTTAPVSSILARDRAVAGVNGDFFDIGGTGAPLGIGRDRQRGLLNGPLSGWNSAFSIGRGGRPDIGPLVVRTRIKQRPRIAITNLNSPAIARGGIGVYTRAWGDTSGYRVTGGQRRHVRMVQVVGGRVVRNTRRLPHGTPVRGKLLIGRGYGVARQLKGLRKGARLTVVSGLQGAPRMAITGNKFLIRDGVVEVVDDRELHPRTAVGIDRDTRTLLFLVVEGRQSFSRGYTMVELADKMIELGADEALEPRRRRLDHPGRASARRGRGRRQLAVRRSPAPRAQRGGRPLPRAALTPQPTATTATVVTAARHSSSGSVTFWGDTWISSAPWTISTPGGMSHPTETTPAYIVSCLPVTASTLARTFSPRSPRNCEA